MGIGNRSKTEVLAELREMLSDVFRLRQSGIAYAKLQRAHGYADGYMKVLLDAGVVTKSELLALVSAERERVDGPATAVVSASAA
ncbi:MAG TPA: hypothetical protein VL137_01025 [Polyangiaceae bacterium]|nr:hypothetical protein [Polyangiaceae bacterium]